MIWRRSISTPSGRSRRAVNGSDSDCLGSLVAREADQMHRFSGAIDAAIGVQIGIDRPRRRAPGDAAVAQIEGGAADFEKIEVAVLAVGHDRERLVAAGAVREPARDPGEPVGIARDARQLAVVAGIKAHGNAGNGPGVRERADRDHHFVGRAVRRQAEIGDEHPIGRGPREIVRAQIGPLDD